MARLRLRFSHADIDVLKMKMMRQEVEERRNKVDASRLERGMWSVRRVKKGSSAYGC